MNPFDGEHVYDSYHEYFPSNLFQVGMSRSKENINSLNSGILVVLI